jgi:DNA-binding NarL/FixJ family response regulator
MALEQSIRVVLADDNLIVREGVRALLAISGDVEVVGVAGDYDELLAGAAEHVPHVVVTDIRMPPDFTDEGIRAGRIVRKQHPGSVIDPRGVEVLVAARSAVRDSPIAQLTPRERDVLQQVAMGKNNAGIAAALFLTERAVEKHINATFSKLELSEEPDVHRRVKAALVYLAAQR